MPRTIFFYLVMVSTWAKTKYPAALVSETETKL